MLTALPPKAVTAIEDDRPIVVGQVAELDFYLQAHEAKNRGYHARAVCLLCLSARNLGLTWTSFGDVCLDWDFNLEAIDEAWGKAQGGHGN